MNHNSNIRIVISIVNYCSANLVCQLLPDLVSELEAFNARVVIVDNHSPDNSISLLTDFIQNEKLHDSVSLVSSDINGGFSYGNNLAINYAIETLAFQPDYVFLLNPDTKILKSALCKLIDFMETHPKAGVAGSQLVSEAGDIQRSAFNFHSLISEALSSLRIGLLDKYFSNYLVSSEFIPKNSCLVDWVAGASMLVRYSMLENIGLMDESYFLYFEETDFCLQAKRAGWECWYVPQSQVVHYVGQSTGVVSGDVSRRRRPKYWFQSRQYYFRKNHGFFYCLIADLIWGLGYSFTKLRYFIQGKKSSDPVHMWKDFWRNSILFSWIK
ncbi:glycosyl transferase [Methylophaga marina]|uniref:Glycosyltransferase family 2 protein n=1 Tax=Methylophaga marina TaxID=45495 RepID=A0ABN0TLQ4_9GAMM|nr:glycosyltransferase family 2 protein [Methylophaga marina]BDZ74641.1 glycosyl transferase [Methylophaga marina]